jgi:hypothetical protein
MSAEDGPNLDPGNRKRGFRFRFPNPEPFSAETVRAHLGEILPDGRSPEPLRTGTRGFVLPTPVGHPAAIR